MGVSEKTITDFLRQNEKWISEKEKQLSEIQKKFPKKQFVKGERFLFKGEAHHLSFEASPDQRIKFHPNAGQLICKVPYNSLKPDLSPMPGLEQDLKEALGRLYEKEGRALLAERTKLFANKMGLHPAKISYRSQRSRWGSCTTQGHISLNWRLAFAPLEVLDYVVIHELAHLRFPNHSRSFWHLVETFCPDFKTRQKWLKEHQSEVDFLEN